MTDNILNLKDTNVHIIVNNTQGNEIWLVRKQNVVKENDNYSLPCEFQLYVMHFLKLSALKLLYNESIKECRI